MKRCKAILARKIFGNDLFTYDLRLEWDLERAMRFIPRPRRVNIPFETLAAYRFGWTSEGDDVRGYDVPPSFSYMTRWDVPEWRVAK